MTILVFQTVQTIASPMLEGHSRSHSDLEFLKNTDASELLMGRWLSRGRTRGEQKPKPNLSH
jgi:hypothetical protein